MLRLPSTYLLTFYPKWINDGLIPINGAKRDIGKPTRLHSYKDILEREILKHHNGDMRPMSDPLGFYDSLSLCIDFDLHFFCLS